MITCPVCEHQQQSGAECENCGKQFSTRAPPVEVQRLPELEQTLIVDPRLRVDAAPMAELEATRLRGGPDLPAQQVPELEMTSMASAGNVAVEKLPELDLARAEDDGVRTAAPTGPLTCRYCHNVQAEGLVCEKCGMRLPRAAAPQAPEAVVLSPDDDEWTRCRDCGSRAKRGTRCGNCGHMVEPAAG